MTPASPAWHPPVHTCSALTGDGLAEIWARIGEHRRALGEAGEFERRRRSQRVRWMWSAIRDRLMLSLDRDHAVRAVVADAERNVAEGRVPPRVAADRVLEAVRGAG